MKRKTQAKLSKKVVAEMPMMTERETAVNVSVAPKKFFVILALIVLLGGLLVLGAKKYKGLVIAGMVNGKPITRWQLEKVMNDRYAKVTFDDLAGTILVNRLATENGVTVSEDDVKNETTATEQRLGGKEALQTTLDRMGYTNARFQEEMRVQVLVQKLSAKLFKIEVTEEEVKKFFNENTTLFPKKTLEQVKEDIKQNIFQQKAQQQFATWFQDQKKKAEIKSYL